MVQGEDASVTKQCTKCVTDLYTILNEDLKDIVPIQNHLIFLNDF